MELTEVNSKSDFLKFKSEAIKNSRSNANNYFSHQSIDIKEEYDEEIVLIKLQSQEGGIEVNLFNQKYRNQSALIIQKTFNNTKSSIYWKSAEIEEFLTLKQNEKLKTEASGVLNEFIVDFLVAAVKSNQLGLISKFYFQAGMKPVNLDLLADSRDFNLLLIAAEHGNSEIVKILLQQGMNTNSLDNKIDVQTLAWNNQHFDVLCQLLQANLKFPASFDTALCTGKCKEFCEITEEVHKLIKADDIEKLKVILNQHKNLKHFYNFSNESALKVAILSGSYETYRELTSRKFRYASHEDPAEYLEDLEYRGTTTILINGYDLEFGLKKLAKFYSNLEIYEIFLKTKILNSAASFRNYTFQPLWNFFINHTTIKQQKSMLTRIVRNECFTRPFKGDEQLRYCYVFPPLNMLQTSIFSFEKFGAFKDMLMIYETYFNRTEIQEIILRSTSDFLPILIVQGDYDLCEEATGNLRKLFIGNEETLKKFLLQEVEPTNLNVFDLLRDFRDHNNCLELFTKFLE
ncbi:hypothetical protein ACKWTF_013033 [Chironomus riparius]